MLPSSPFAVAELARQQQAELARKARKGHVRFAPGRRRRWRDRRGPG